MKRRILRKEVEYVLFIITAFLFILLCSIDDFELEALPLILIGWIIFYINSRILIKYGVRRFME